MDQFGGVDFDKGCYLGQEIIARVHFKGKTKQAVRIGQIDQPVQGDEPLTVTDSEGHPSEQSFKPRSWRITGSSLQ